MDHAKLVREDILRATLDQNLGIGRIGAENTGIESKLQVDVVNAAVVGTARRVAALRRLGVRPVVDEILLVAARVLLVGLDLAEEDTRARLDTRRVVELDRRLANGIEELARRLVDRTRKVKLVAICATLGANDPEILLDRVVHLDTNIRTDTGRVLRRTRRRLVSLGRDLLDLINELDKRVVCEDITLRLLKVDLVGLDGAREVTVRERRKRERALIESRLELLIRKTVGTNLDLRIARVDDGILTARKVNVVGRRVERERTERQGQVAVGRVAKRDGNLQVAATLGKLLALLDRVKLADELVNLLARLGRERVPQLELRALERVDGRVANAHGDLAQEAETDGILPRRRIGTLDNLAILDSDETGQIDLGLRVPREITLARKRKLGLATKTRLRGRRVKLDRLERKRRMSVVDKTPKVGLGLRRHVVRQELVRMTLVTNLLKNGIVRRATHLFRNLCLILANRTRATFQG